MVLDNRYKGPTKQRNYREVEEVRVSGPPSRNFNRQEVKLIRLIGQVQPDFIGWSASGKPTAFGAVILLVQIQLTQMVGDDSVLSDTVAMPWNTDVKPAGSRTCEKRKQKPGDFRSIESDERS